MTSTQQKPKAVILTNGMLLEGEAKTAHGLIRGTDRFSIEGVIDKLHFGKDAGELLDGRHRHIPVFADLEEAMAAVPGLKYCIIGVATHGGILPKEFLEIIKVAISNKLSVVNGLHQFLSDNAEMAALASENNVELIDIREPKKRSELHFWHGEINKVNVPIIAVLGMDCALGKRTTCRMVKEACEVAGLNVQMIYTGQTGWLQGGEYGFIFDTTVNDFISGEIEHAIVSCWKETNPDAILIEGQSSLRNPSGPCGSEFLISGNAKYVILVHAPKRIYFDHLPAWGKIATVSSEMELVKMYGSEVIALALNTELCTGEEAYIFQKSYEDELEIPVLLPLQEGVDKIIPLIRKLSQEKRSNHEKNKDSL
jgi:uncharacterized NAD-dependent epimerase/dehydratase family protein